MLVVFVYACFVLSWKRCCRLDASMDFLATVVRKSSWNFLYAVDFCNWKSKQFVPGSELVQFLLVSVSKRALMSVDKL